MTFVPVDYSMADASWMLRFSPAVLSVMTQYVQRGLWSRETVGQLYTKDLTSPVVIVERATVLVPSWASRFRVRIDNHQAMAEREAQFAEGYHCVGLWHTHPESLPTPSGLDRNLARDYALAARPQLAGLVFAILGTTYFPDGLRVWIDDGMLLHETRRTSEHQR